MNHAMTDSTVFERLFEYLQLADYSEKCLEAVHEAKKRYLDKTLNEQVGDQRRSGNNFIAIIYIYACSNAIMEPYSPFR
jgi:hypothetical protein